MAMQPNVVLDLGVDGEIDLSNADGDFSNASGKKKKPKKKFGSKIKKALSAEQKRLADRAKKIKAQEKAFIAKSRKGLKSLADKLKHLPANIRKGIQNTIRKGIRQGVLNRIQHNAHGTAIQLYPAIAPANEPLLKIISPSYVKSAKASYVDVVKHWKDLGGNQAELNNAIKAGSKEAILKNPYPTRGLAKAHLQYKAKKGKQIKNSFDGEVNYGVDSLEIPSNVAWEPSNLPMDTSLDYTTTPAELATPTSAPAQEVKLHGIRAFFAWLKNLFHRHKHPANPFVAPTAPFTSTSVATPAVAATYSYAPTDYGQQMAQQLQQQLNGDVYNVPLPQEMSNPVMDTLIATSVPDGAGTPTDATSVVPDSTPAPDDTENQQEMQEPTPDQEAIEAGAEPDDGSTDEDDDKIFGMSKTVVYVGGALLLLGVAYFLYKKFGNKKGKVHSKISEAVK